MILSFLSDNYTDVVINIIIALDHITILVARQTPPLNNKF